MANRLHNRVLPDGALGARVLAALGSGQRQLLWRSSGIALLAVTFAFSCRMIFLRDLGSRLEYAAFYPAITIAALAAGWHAGALAIVLSALAMIVWIDPAPLGDLGGWLAHGIFVLSGGLITAVTEIMRRFQARATALEEEAKRAKAVRENAERLQLLLAHAPAALAMFDRKMRYLATSRRWRADHGLEGRDLRGLSHYEVSPEIPDRWREAHRRALKGEVLRAEEDAFERPGGRVRWLCWEVRPWQDGAGQIGGVVIFAEDITSRKEAEIAIKQREEELRAVFEAAADAIFTIDEKGLIQSANPAAIRLFGYETSELIGQNISMLIPEPDKGRHDGYIQSYLRTGEAKIIGHLRAVEAVRKNGRRLSVELAVGEAAHGGRRIFVGVLHDITEHKQAARRQLALLDDLRQSEAQAREQEARFRSIFESAPEGIVLTDTRRRVTLVNSAIERIFGYRSGELIGSPVSKLFEHSEAWKPVAAAEPGGTGRVPQIARFVRKNGEVFTGETIRVRCLDSEAKPLGYLRTIRDVPQEEKRQQERQRAQRLAALGQLTGGIAHDFNNLLTVISGNLQLLEMRLKDQTLARYLREIDRAIEMSERLSQRLMTFASQRKLTPAVANLNDVVGNMLELLQRTIGAQITITTILADELWLTRVDTGEIENAVLNLAINARDAMPEGGRLLIKTLNVAIGGESPRARHDIPPGSYVCLSVSDTGSGMPPEVLARVFEPFFTTKEHGKGTGLGLASIYGFVKQSGGEIRIYSEAGRGTTVNIYLPRHEGDGQTDLVPQEAAVPVGGMDETILVVEDNPDVRKITAERLEALGYKVLEAEHARQALSLLQAAAPIDLVFSDVAMPGGMSGIELARIIRERWPSQKLLLASGFPGQLLGGAEDGEVPRLLTLTKPYSQIELGRAIRHALEA